MFGLTKLWESAEATILAVTITRVSSDGLTPTRTWAAEVRKADGTAFRARIDEPRWVTDFWPPDVGDTVAVQVEARSSRVRFDVRNDPRLSMKGRDRAQAQAFREALEGDQPLR